MPETIRDVESNLGLKVEGDFPKGVSLDTRIAGRVGTMHIPGKSFEYATIFTQEGKYHLRKVQEEGKAPYLAFEKHD